MCKSPMCFDRNELNHNGLYLSGAEILYLATKIKGPLVSTNAFMLWKLAVMECTALDGIKSIDYLMKNGSYIWAGGFRFRYDALGDYIEIYDKKSGRFAKKQRAYMESLDDLSELFVDYDEIAQRYSGGIRYCSICGSPLDRGFTDGDEWICSGTEFMIHLDSVYGEGKWRPSTERETHEYGCLYVYRDKDTRKMKPVDWYYTELEEAEHDN